MGLGADVGLFGEEEGRSRHEMAYVVAASGGAAFGTDFQKPDIEADETPSRPDINDAPMDFVDRADPCERWKEPELIA